MKIRITGKGLPKAQWLNSQVGEELNIPQGTPNYNWTSFNQTDYSSLLPKKEVVNQDGTKTVTGGNGPQVTLYANQNVNSNQTNFDPYEVKPFRIRYRNSGPPKILPQYPKWQTDFNKGIKKFETGVDKFRNDLGNSFIGKFSKKIEQITDLASPFLIGLDNKKKYKRTIDRAREMNLPENMYFDSTVDNGDWDQEGIFQPDNLGFDSKGEYTNATYAPLTYASMGGNINNQSMKIRITGVPEMAYGGQSNYGLDLGQRNVYTEMPKTKSESVSSSISAVPREMANIEAEGGETVFGDIDNDGHLEHMKITGKRHTQGGVPLNVPEGSFVYSDTKKMRIKDPEMLRSFGLSPKPGGYTPAEIAKRYDINKYKSIIEDPTADEISKGTAQLMLKNYTKKLAMLALIQESMKGFPQGVPDVAEPLMGGDEDAEKMKYGGLPKFQGLNGSSQVGANVPAIMQFLSPDVIALAKKIKEEDELKRRNDASSQPDYNLILNQNGVYSYDGDPGKNLVSTTATGQRAGIDDPEYSKFMDLLKKYTNATRAAQNRKNGDTRDYYYINNLDGKDSDEFARLATKFGFRRDAEGSNKGYVIVQGATPGYTFTGSNGKLKGYFGGYKPEDYERTLVGQMVGADALNKMSPLEIRKAYFKELGIDISNLSDQQLSDTKKLYNNKNFFEKTYYPKFIQYFNQGEYRPEMKDDSYFGAEHKDAINLKPRPAGYPILGYTCQKNADGTVVPLENQYMDEQARIDAGAYTSPQEAMAACNKTREKQPLWRCIGVRQDGTAITIKDALGTYTSQEEAAKFCNPTKGGTFDYMFPDRLGMWNALQGRPKRYYPFKRNVPFEPGKVVFEDWRAKAAQRYANQYVAPSEQLAAYTSPQGLAANMAFLSGQAGEGIGQDIAGVDSRNVATANQFLQSERQRKDQFNILDASNAQDYWKELAITNNQGDNADRAWKNNLTKVAQNAWANRMYLGMLNSVNPVFNVDPNSGRSFFMRGYDPYNLANVGQRATSMNATDLNRQYLTDVPDGKGMSFKEWRDLKYGSMPTSNQGVMFNPAMAAASQMLPLYGSLARGFEYNPGMSQFFNQGYTDY